MNILTFPKYCFFGLGADLGTDKDPPAAKLSTETADFSRVHEAPASHLSPNDSCSVTALALGTLLSLTLSLVDTGLAPFASSHAKYLHSDRLPLGHAKNDLPALGPGDRTVHCLVLRPQLQIGDVRRIAHRVTEDDDDDFNAWFWF